MDIILASTSPYRRQLLERLRIPFRCAAPCVDEDSWKATEVASQDLSEQLALAKAEAVASEYVDAVVIGSDQIADLEGGRLDKPGSQVQAVAQLERLAGRSHRLITAVAVIYRGRAVTYTDITTLQMRMLSHDEIERYVAADEPYGCAGSYKLESLGISLFESIDSADHTAITGLPLMAVCRMLRECGVFIP